MTDQPNPMSVEEAIETGTIRLVRLTPMTEVERSVALGTLIAAVERRERERVLAEFRMLAEKYSTINYAPIRDSTEHKNAVTAGMKIVQGELSALIQSLETSNQKPK